MFRNFLSSDRDEMKFNVKWVKKLGGLIRVVIFDSDALSNKAFVTVYHEQKNRYTAVAFDITTGEICWTKDVANGGYGAPIVTDNAFILPTKFTDIVALSKDDGCELWRVETNCRVRSPLNFKRNRIYFSSGGTIFELESGGKLLNQWHYEGAFFYGAVDVFNELIISLGTVSDENEDSVIKVFAFHKNGGLVYSLPISKSSIISADTVGIAWREGVGFVGGNDLIVSFQINDGKVLWASTIEGFAGRQACSVDDSHVYYSTLAGKVGALNIENGAHVWQINTNDTSIVSPISILGRYLLLLADAHLNIFKSDNGQLLHKVPVGHSPYSMVSIKGDYGLLGAGEPPHNGLLFAFTFSDENLVNEKYECFSSTSNAFIDSPFVDILVKITGADDNFLSTKLDGSIFNLSEAIDGEQVGITTFAFRVALPRTINSGDYVIPLYINTKDECFIKPICISFKRKKPLPQKAYLNHIPDIVQEKPTYSGAAIGSALKNLYGDYVEQSDLREMIDCARNYSGYEPFQTWRILLRRMLTSSAVRKEQLPEFDQLNCMHDE